jgi:hypothetical protein
VGTSIERAVSIVLYNEEVECAIVGGLQRSSAQGYIMVRDIVTVGVCDDGCGRWCGCFVRWTGSVCLRKAQIHPDDLIGCCTGA